MEEKSGVTFNRARVAMARKWIGKIDESLIQDKGWNNCVLLLRMVLKLLPVSIATPLPSKDGMIEEGDNKKVEEFKYPETEEEADEIIKRFEAASTRSDDLVSGSVAHHALADTTDLFTERWLGTEEEERNWYGLFSSAPACTEPSMQ